MRQQPVDHQVAERLGRQKTLARWMIRGGYISVVLAFVLPVANHYLHLMPVAAGYLVPIGLLLVLLLGGSRFRRHVEEKQKQLGIDRTPDEIRAAEKKARKRQELLASPEAVDRRLALLARLRTFFRWTIIVGLVLLLASVVLVIFQEKFNPSEGVVIGLAFGTSIALFGGIIGREWTIGRQKDLSLAYTPGVLAQVFDQVEAYDPEGSVDHSYLGEDFAYGRWDYVGTCGDYVRGVLQGIPLAFCEYKLMREDETTDSDGDKQKEIVTCFTGLMVVCRHGYRINNPVTLTQFSRYQPDLTTESEEFSRAWSIKESSGHDAFYLLTPQVVETLLQLSIDRAQRLGIQYRPDGTMLFVMKDADFFEAEQSKSVEELKAKLTAELLELADSLRRAGALTQAEIDRREEAS